VSETSSNSLADRLRARIKREGPITFCDWMQAALYDERDGYYCRPDRIRQGRAGDYRTAPEISPLFAATLANYFANLFADLGSPQRFTILECGGGSGQFAHGVLTTLRKNHPAVFEALNYVIEDASASSREAAAAKLSEFSDRVSMSSVDFSLRSPLAANPASQTKVHAMGRASDTDIVFSNELIDAFPVHRVTGRGGELKELCVGLNGSDEFVWVENEPGARVVEYCDRIQLRLAEGQIFEINLGAEEFVRQAGLLLNSGYLITVDYGATRNDLLNDPHRFSGTLRTFHRHRLGDDALSSPGEYDLTTTIDWTQMTEAGQREGFETFTLQRLDQFLLTHGAVEAMQALAASLSDQVELFNFNAAARELIMPDGMAASFQVLVQRKQSQ